MAPRGSTRNTRCQLRGLWLHDRTNTRFSTTTAQMPMKRWGSIPARKPMIWLAWMALTTSSEKPRLAFITRLTLRKGLRSRRDAHDDDQALRSHVGHAVCDAGRGPDHQTRPRPLAFVAHHKLTLAFH